MSAPRRAVPSRAFVSLCAALALTACSEATTAPKPIDQLPRPLTSAEQAIVTGSSDFAFALLRELDRSTSPDSNLFISPLSASMALGMTATGAAGATLDAMRNTLGLPGMEIADMDASYRSLIDLLRGLDQSVDFRIANSIWYRQGFPVEPAFLDDGKRYFDAEIAELDFTDPGAPATINDWVKRGTNGKIEKIVEDIPDSMVMYLINAIYFKGTWTYQFEKSKTSDQPFFAVNGSTPSVPLMHLSGSFLAASTSDYQAAELPYGGGAYSMIVVVPTKGRDVDALIESLDAAKWQAMLSGLTEQSGDVFLPRFRLEWKDSLVDALEALGMGIAFRGGEADFTRMSTVAGRNIFISSVDQKTYVDVDEDGTEAAAVTSVGMVDATSVSPTDLLRADRPFLFAIRERLSGTILFIGKMAMPPA